MGIETDTRKFKFGNGTTQWNAIPYASSGGGDGGGFFVSETAPVGPNIGDIWYCSASTGDLAGKSFIRYDGYWVELNPGTLGPVGATGETGATGPANTLTVGTVTTLAAGSLATVTITGTAPNQTINFDIPEGEQGIQGVQGIQGIQGIQGEIGPQGPAGADGGFDSTQTVESVGTSRALTAADKGKLITNSAAITITVQGLAVGEQVDFLQTNAAQITFQAGSGITLNSKDAKLKTNKQYSPVSVKCIASNSYVLLGDLG
jgi:hypothetical protein